MNAKEELTKLLMESYDRGVKDAKQEALAALEKVVAVMVAYEREACAKVCEDLHPGLATKVAAEHIRARGEQA
jgi:hypothetical protein